ncbi:MAG: PP2C family protein-serine/threonine phosphatase [Candidatus Omnitrophota bacterium]
MTWPFKQEKDDQHKPGKFKSIKDIPEKYVAGFIFEQTRLIKSRVNLFCALAIILYFSAVISSLIIYPDTVITLDIILGGVLFIAASIILYFNWKTKSLLIAKVNAYLFTALILVVLVKLGMVYGDAPVISASIFVFTIFLVSVTIPWKPIEIIIIGLMHVIAYSATFLYVKHLTGTDIVSFGLNQYLDGLIFLMMAFSLCIVVRMKETARDIENFVLFKEVEEQSDQMSKELELATRIHKTLVPESMKSPKVDIAVSYLPVYYMGGDYAKYKFLDNNKFIFIICDVTGHGVSAALLVNRIHAEFERLVQEGEGPGVLLRDLNSFIEQDFAGTEMYLSAFCGLVDLNEMCLKYSNYGHPPQYVYHSKEDEIVPLKAQASLLGIPLEDNGLYETKVKVEKGDRILLFTDGLIETVDKEGVQYGGERLEEFLAKNRDLPAEEFNRALLKNVDRYQSGKSRDDIFILDIGIKGVENAE